MEISSKGPREDGGFSSFTSYTLGNTDLRINYKINHSHGFLLLHLGLHSGEADCLADTDTFLAWSLSSASAWNPAKPGWRLGISSRPEASVASLSWERN